MAEKKEEGTKTNTTRAAFAALLDPLEQVTGRRLGNPQRQMCFQEFQRQPGAVRRVAEDALADATGNAVGLFTYRIKHGWHELEPLPAPEPDPPLRADDVSRLLTGGPVQKRRVWALLEHPDEVIDESLQSREACKERIAELRATGRVVEAEIR